MELRNNRKNFLRLSGPLPLSYLPVLSTYAICFTVSINRRAGTPVHSEEIITSPFSGYDPYMDRLI